MNDKNSVSLRARLVRSALSLMRGPFSNVSVNEFKSAVSLWLEFLKTRANIAHDLYSRHTQL
jgi:hypothetical protein